MTQTDDRPGVIYARQSHGKETSVEDQVDAGHSRCASLKIPVAEVYRDKVSASRFGHREREDWPRLVADVESGRPGFVWLWDASRGDRLPESWFCFLGACRDQRVLLFSERDDYAYRPWIPRDWKTLAELGVDAAYESEIKSVDVRRGIDGAALKGKPHGPVRDGYDRVYDPTDRRKFTDVPNSRAPIIAEIITRVARRDPIIVIARDLTERGVPTPAWRGVPWEMEPWKRNTVRAIARNPGYAGLRRHNDQLIKGKWEAIVSRETWETARAVLAEPDRKSSAPGALKYLLSYLMVGPHGVLQVNPATPPRSPLYRCAADGCMTIGMAQADEFVTRAVLARLALPDARKLFEANTEDMTEALGEVAAIEAEARELEAEVRSGRLRPALAAAFDAGIQERLKAAQERALTLSGNSAVLAFMGKEAFAADVARPRWDALSVAARRSIIELLIARIELSPTTVRGTRWTTEEQRLRQAVERIRITWREPS